MAIYTLAQRKYLSSLDPRDPEYLGPDDDEVEESTDEFIPNDPIFDDYTPLDNPADDYIMTERELRGEL